MWRWPLVCLLFVLSIDLTISNTYPWQGVPFFVGGMVKHELPTSIQLKCGSRCHCWKDHPKAPQAGNRSHDLAMLPKSVFWSLGEVYRPTALKLHLSNVSPPIWCCDFFLYSNQSQWLNVLWKWLHHSFSPPTNSQGTCQELCFLASTWCYVFFFLDW